MPRIRVLLPVMAVVLAQVVATEVCRLERKAFAKGPSPVERGLLSRQKVIITDQSCRQIFSPYVDPDMPVFITSDSILNAYHVLLQESILGLENANSVRLPEILRFIWDNLATADQHVEGNPQLAAAAKRRAQIVVATAIRLLGDSPPELPPSIAGIVEEQVACIRGAAGVHRPGWLGEADDPQLVAIDYSRYIPRGFYADIASLARYFRAVSWLQSIPFRVDRDEELLAILMLGSCLSRERFDEDDPRTEQYAAFFDCFRELLGDRDDWDLTSAAAEVQGVLKLDLAAGDLERMRQSLRERAERTGHRPQINDQIGYPSESADGPIPLSFRIVSAYRTPDAILFGRTTDPGAFSRPFPSGLEVCIALGSSYAKRALDDPEKEKVIKTVERSADLLVGSSLYFDYLDCVGSLLHEPPEGAPAFMSTDAWRAKSCQTALAGWAQLRHTWTLQSKQTFCWLCLMESCKHVGFVEPNPEFFRRLKALAHRTGTLMNRASARFDRRLYVVAELQDLLRILESKLAAGEGLDDEDTCSASEYLAYRTLEQVMGIRDVEEHAKQHDFLVEAVAKTKAAIDHIQRGEDYESSFNDMMAHSTTEPLHQLWRELADLSGRLCTLAEKELAGTPFDQEDNRFILEYGEALAPLMFHIGHASETPRDDVPKVIDVVYSPNVGEYLEVGIGRPRIMYVLYPTKDGEVLCRGAVLPYYEFRSDKRLNDGEWKLMLDSADAPDPPDWLTSLVPPTSSQKTHRQAGRGPVPVWAYCGAAAVAVTALWFTFRRRRRAGKAAPAAAGESPPPP